MLKRLVQIVVLTLCIAAAFVSELPRMLDESFNKLVRKPPYAASARAFDLHKTLTVADLHADSLLWGRDLLERGTYGQVDIPRLADGPRIARKFAALRPADPRCTLTVTGQINRPPMERSRGGVRLFRKAHALAHELAFELNEASTGGGSDGNFTAALGIPTLDGMGAVGEGAHAPHESVLVEHLAPRTALLAAMLID